MAQSMFLPVDTEGARLAALVIAGGRLKANDRESALVFVTRHVPSALWNGNDMDMDPVRREWWMREGRFKAALLSYLSAGGEKPRFRVKCKRRKWRSR